MSCAQWLAYRTGDARVQGLGLVLVTLLQGYIDAANEFANLFNGNLVLPHL